MRAVQAPDATSVLGAPPGWEQGALPCGALAIKRTTLNGFPAIISTWRPTLAEIAALNNGECVELCIIGVTHPPVAVNVTGVTGQDPT